MSETVQPVSGETPPRRGFSWAGALLIGSLALNLVFKRRFRYHSVYT